MTLYHSDIREIFERHTVRERRILTWRGLRKIKVVNHQGAMLDICRTFAQEFKEQQQFLNDKIATMRQQIESAQENSDSDLLESAPGYVFAELRVLFDRLTQAFNEDASQHTPAEVEVLDKIRDILERDHEEQFRIVDQVEQDSLHQMDRLRRRLDRMTKDLKLSEEEVARLRGELETASDGGVASIYKSVQGISDGDAHAESKRDLLSKLFESNLEIRKKLS